MRGTAGGHRKPRVLVLTQYFPPEPYPQTLWLAEALREEGLAVRVCTSVPNYPTGEVLPGYQASRLSREEISRFPVTRVPVFPSHSKAAIARIVNYGSFSMSVLLTSRSVLRTADVVLVWATPATVGFPALVERVIFGVPYVLYVQDLWPDSVFASGFLAGGRIRRLTEMSLRPFLSTLYSKASHVAAISPGMERELIRRGVSETRCSHIYNWVDESVLGPRKRNGELRRSLGLSEGQFLIAYAGNVGSAQGLEPWIEAMSRIPRDSDSHLVFIGDGSEKLRLQRRVEDLGTSNVHFLPSVASQRIAGLLADADCLAISLADQELFRITMPSKVQASLALGKPVVAAVSGDARAVLQEAKAGWLAEPGNAASIMNAVLDSKRAGPHERQQRGLSGRSFYETHMRKAVGSKAMASLLVSAARERRR